MARPSRGFLSRYSSSIACHWATTRSFARVHMFGSHLGDDPSHFIFTEHTIRGARGAENSLGHALVVARLKPIGSEPPFDVGLATERAYFDELPSPDQARGHSAIDLVLEIEPTHFA